MSQKIRLGLVLQGGDSWRGGAEYFANLIKALAPLEARGEISLAYFAHEVDTTAFSDSIVDFDKRVLPFVPKRPRIPLSQRFRKLITGAKPVGSAQLQDCAGEHGIDFLYPYYYPYQPISGEKRCVSSAAWIPDFQHKLMPEFFAPEELLLRDRAHARAAHLTDCLIVSSQAAERDFRAFHDARHTHTEVLHFHTTAHDDWFKADPGEVLATYKLPQQFFLCANQFWIHKNHGTVFRAVGILKQRGVRVNLVCTGHLHDYRHPDYTESVRRLIADLGIDDHVFLLGLIPRPQQIQLYRQAVAVVQPSLFEGWSTVVEDSRALGKRVLLSDIEVHREQSPPGCIFFEPRSPEMLADLMARSWAELPVGPQPATEATAKEESRAAVGRFAENFVRIARTTALRHPQPSTYLNYGPKKT